jgi:hypothetical protein
MASVSWYNSGDVMMVNSFHVVFAAAVLGGSLLSGELHVVLFL